MEILEEFQNELLSNFLIEDSQKKVFENYQKEDFQHELLNCQLNS